MKIQPENTVNMYTILKKHKMFRTKWLLKSKVSVWCDLCTLFLGDRLEVFFSHLLVYYTRLPSILPRILLSTVEYLNKILRAHRGRYSVCHVTPGVPLADWTKIPGAFRKGGALCCKLIYITLFYTVVLSFLRNCKRLSCKQALLKAIVVFRDCTAKQFDFILKPP